MDDLTAASYDDVVQFFKSYYVPNNASLVVAGDIDVAKTRALVEKWFGDVPRGPDVPPVAAPPAVLTEVKRKTLTDRVQLPRLYLAWLTPPQYAPGDAAMDLVGNVLAGGKNSRLYKRLVYDLQIAQNVSATQQSDPLVSTFLVTATARPGHTLDEIRKVIDEEIEKLKTAPPEAREVERGVNQYEAGFLRAMEQVGSFGGKADQLNAYFTSTGMPDYFEEDVSRYRAIAPDDLRSAAQRFLPSDRRVELSVVPEKKDGGQ
jgi:zinc protease